MSVKGMAAPDVEGAIVRAHELCELLGDPLQSFAVLFGLWTVHFIRGEFRTAYEYAEQIMHRARRASDSSLLLFAHVALGNNSFNMGKLVAARDHLEATISLYDPELHSIHATRFVVVNPKANCLGYLGMALWALGFPDEALKRGREAVAFARALPHPHSEAAAGNFLSTIHQYRGEAQAALETAESAAAVSARHGFSLWSSPAKVQHGSAMVELGRGQQEAIDEMSEGLRDFRATGAGIGLPHFLSLLVGAYEKTGRFQDGLRTLREAIAIVNEHDEGRFEAELNRLMGEFLLKQNDSNAAEAQGCFERAIAFEARPSRRSACNARRHLRLVHRGLRYRRPHRRQKPDRAIGELSEAGNPCVARNADVIIGKVADFALIAAYRLPLSASSVALRTKLVKDSAESVGLRLTPQSALPLRHQSGHLYRRRLFRSPRSPESGGI
jgi:tetratricopeptide (TPR) repeat protein